MSESQTINAVIRETTLSIADHGVLSSFVHLDFGSSGQGFGGYTLGDLECKRHSAEGNYAAEFIVRVLLAAGVDEWSKLRGQTVRVKKDGFSGPIEAIGHIVDDDKWFCPDETFKSWNPAP